MKNLALLPVLFLSLASLPSQAAPTSLSPYGREDNAIGTLRWLPRNANEKPPTNQFRLVVVYDRSMNESGQPINLKAKGPFGVKIFTGAVADLKMKGHSSKVGDLNTLTGQPLPPQVNETAIGVYGDVRDGVCTKVGTPAFSAAYTTTRTFLHAGAEPYQAQTGPGTCEVVDASTPVRDSTGAIVGYDTRVTNHVPGFWIDVEWPTRALTGLGTGRLNAEVWYGAAYDDDGDPGPFPRDLDTTGASRSLPAPGDYNATFSFTAQPGAVGVECVNTGGNGQPRPGTFQDVQVVVPQNATKVTFKLSNHADWDLVVLNPDGLKRTSGNGPPLDETSVAPSTSSNGSTTQPNFPTLVPGTWIMRACNFAGEPTVIGGVIIETA